MKNIILILPLLLPVTVIANESCNSFVKKHNLEIMNIESNCLWNESRTAIAVCSNEQTTKCYIVDSETVTDVSIIQKSNLGKISIIEKSKYESVITEPKKWLSSKKKQYLVLFQTRAWLKGQRYTVSGPAAVVNGEYHGQ